MQFCTSTQAKSWTFSLESLAECKRRALSFDLNHSRRKSNHSINQVRKFASGFQKRNEEFTVTTQRDATAPTNLSMREHEIMIQFHAHQIQFLIGPNAILYDLRTSEKVLSTAIIFFRRFYLSNSIIEISPRKIAAACVFFAAKVEEEKVEIGQISNATALVQQRVHNAPLCCKELRAVPVIEIEYAERLLIEGLNYEFHCYHTADVIDEIFMRTTDTATSQYTFDENSDRGDVSPRSAATSYECTISSYREVDCHGDLCRRREALDIAQRANIFSDVHFLYAPCDIAFAIAAIVTGSFSIDTGDIGSKLFCKYMDMYPEKSGDNSFAFTILDIIVNLLNCPNMALCPIYDHNASNGVTERAEELRRIMGEVATIRLLRKMKRNSYRLQQHQMNSAITTTLLDADGVNRRERRRISSSNFDNSAILQYSSCKRSRMQVEMDFTPPRLIRTCVKITPTTTGYYRYFHYD